MLPAFAPTGGAVCLGEPAANAGSAELNIISAVKTRTTTSDRCFIISVPLVRFNLSDPHCGRPPLQLAVRPTCFLPRTHRPIRSQERPLKVFPRSASGGSAKAHPGDICGGSLQTCFWLPTTSLGGKRP